MPETKPSSNVTDSSSPYSGTFTFQNSLSGTIQSGSATHWNSDYGQQTIDLAGLENNQTSAQQSFSTSSSNKDHWGFSATTTDGNSYGYADKDCGFESEDAGGNVQLAAFTDGGIFVVGMPVSSGCEGNMYGSGILSDAKDQPVSVGKQPEPKA